MVSTLSWVSKPISFHSPSTHLLNTVYNVTAIKDHDSTYMPDKTHK